MLVYLFKSNFQAEFMTKTCLCKCEYKIFHINVVDSILFSHNLLVYDFCQGLQLLSFCVFLLKFYTAEVKHTLVHRLNDAPLAVQSNEMTQMFKSVWHKTKLDLFLSQEAHLSRQHRPWPTANASWFSCFVFAVSVSFITLTHSC